MTEKLARVQKNFRSLVSDLGDCWYLSEQDGNYSQAFTKLLKKYHKISWLDECLQILDEDYFMGHYDGQSVRKDHRYTLALHEILCQLTVKNVFGQSLWSEFIFGMSPELEKRAVDTYNLYMKDYTELLEEARKKWDASGKKGGDGGPQRGKSTTP
jgi:hypothetical protein